jgi:hypothetical protein
MQVKIRTKYHGPADMPSGSVRGARIVARGGGRTMSVPYDHGASDPHLVAAQRLAARLAGDAPVPAVTQVEPYIYQTEV